MLMCIFCFVSALLLLKEGKVPIKPQGYTECFLQPHTGLLQDHRYGISILYSVTVYLHTFAGILCIYPLRRDGYIETVYL